MKESLTQTHSSLLSQTTFDTFLLLSVSFLLSSTDADGAEDEDGEDVSYGLGDDGVDYWEGLDALPIDLETSAVSTRLYRADQAWHDVPNNYKPAGNTFLCLKCVFWAFLNASRDGSPLVGLEKQLFRLFQGLSRFVRTHDLSIWGRYGTGHIVAVVFKDLLPHVNGSKAIRRSVNRDAWDLLYKIYGKLRSSPDFTNTVPKADRPTVTTSTVPNPSDDASREHQPSSSSKEAAINQITCSPASARRGR